MLDEYLPADQNKYRYHFVCEKNGLSYSSKAN